MIFLTTLHVNIENVTQRCGHIKSASTKFQLGPLNMRSGCKEATKQFTSFAVREGQQVRYIPNEERHRTGSRSRFGEVANLVIRKLAYLFCRRRDHHQAPVRLRPGSAVGGQEMPSGIGMTTTG